MAAPLHSATMSSPLSSPPPLSPHQRSGSNTPPDNQPILTTPSTTPLERQTGSTRGPPTALPQNTFASLMRASDTVAARAYMLAVSGEQNEDMVKFQLLNCIRALVPVVTVNRIHMPRVTSTLELSMKDLCVDGGASFQETAVQRALTDLDGIAGASFNPTRGIYKADLAMAAASCAYESKLKASNSQRYMSTLERSAAKAPKRAQLHASRQYFCLTTLIVEAKMNEPWRQFCQTLAYALQSYERSACRLGLAWHITRFSRILVIDATTCAVETNDESLRGQNLTMMEFAQLYLKAEQLYHFDVVSKETDDEGNFTLNEHAYAIFGHIITTAASLLTRVPLTGPAHIDELSCRGQNAMDRFAASEVRFTSDNAPEHADEGYRVLVRNARRTLRRAGLISDAAVEDSGDDDDGDEDGAQRGARDKDAASRKRSRSSTGKNPSAGGSGGVKRAGNSRGGPNDDLKSSPRNSSESCDEGDCQDIEDDQTPMSITEPFRVLLAAGLKLTFFSPSDMTTAIEVYSQSAQNAPVGDIRPVQAKPSLSRQNLELYPERVLEYAV